jgi:hypothetical protein
MFVANVRVPYAIGAREAFDVDMVVHVRNHMRVCRRGSGGCQSCESDDRELHGDRIGRWKEWLRCFDEAEQMRIQRDSSIVYEELASVANVQGRCTVEMTYSTYCLGGMKNTVV